MKRLAILVTAAIGLALPLHAESLPGFDRFDLTAAHRARPVDAMIWYPAGGPSYRIPIGDGPIFEPTPVLMAPVVQDGKHPLVLLSHGSGGNADSLGWLASGLVKKGAIVLTVNHPGSTSGDSSPRRSLDLVARANDLKAALDAALANPFFAPFIDENRISTVGFSLGGTTALGLAGLRFDGQVQAERCKTGPDAPDCGFFVRGGADFAAVPEFAADTHDPRITHTVAIDPGFTGSATEDSVATVKVPVQLINLGGDDRWPAVDVGPNGSDLTSRLPEASYSVIAPGNHFTFLATCKPGAEKMLTEEGEDPICTDPPGALRSDAHKQLIEDIAKGLGL